MNWIYFPGWKPVAVCFNREGDRRERREWWLLGRDSAGRWRFWTTVTVVEEWQAYIECGHEFSYAWFRVAVR